jgi:aryl-alcohol dehydrogenase-like predicted oxidoreductase
MKSNQFGRTDLQVSEIGFGGSRIGGVFAGKDSVKDSLNLLRESLDSGITFYDTADMYSQGESEALIGTAFRDRRRQVVIATKGGYCLPARRNLIKRIKPLVRPIIQLLGLKRARLPAGMSGALSQDFSPHYLANALENSLRRLKTDYVDLYQLHSPSVSFMQSGAFADSLETLERLKSQGKLRYYGIGTEVPSEAPQALEAPGVSSVQLGFGLLDLEALETGTLASAAQAGTAIIARGCFGGGLLKEDLDEAQLKALTDKWPRILALRAYAAQSQRSVLDTAFQFCRASPAVSVTLLGMHNLRHLRGNLKCAQAPALSTGEYEDLLRLMRTGSGQPG